MYTHTDTDTQTHRHTDTNTPEGRTWTAEPRPAAKPTLGCRLSYTVTRANVSGKSLAAPPGYSCVCVCVRARYKHTQRRERHVYIRYNM